VITVYSAWAQLWAVKGLYLEDFRSYVAAGQAVRAGDSLYQDGVAQLPTIGGTFKYTPFAGVVFAALNVVPESFLPALALGVNVVALLAIVWMTLGQLGYQRDAGRVAATAALGSACLGLQPVVWNNTWGQVNLILMALVVLDLCGSSRMKGIGVGVAAGIKLLPGIFILYLLITRRFKAAGVATAAFGATVLVGWLLLPHESGLFWGGDLMSAGRINGEGQAAALENQSIRGQLARLLNDSDIPASHWLPVGAAVGVLGLVAAAIASRRGRELVAVATVGVTMVMVSPLAWSHYWVWLVLFLIIGAVAAWQHRSWWVWMVVGGGYLLLFAWPTARGSRDFPVVGLVFLNAPLPAPLLALVQGFYVAVGVALLVAVAVWPKRSHTDRRDVLPDDDGLADGDRCRSDGAHVAGIGTLDGVHNVRAETRTARGLA
jgi:alpha-1,2-mannosyltransferase